MESSFMFHKSRGAGNLQGRWASTRTLDIGVSGREGHDPAVGEDERRGRPREDLVHRLGVRVKAVQLLLKALGERSPIRLDRCLRALR
jgi:hypothetical protein